MRRGTLVDLLAACSKVLREHHYSLLGPNNLDESIPVEWLSVGTNQSSLGNQMRDMAPIFEEQSNGGADNNVLLDWHGDPLSEGRSAKDRLLVFWGLSSIAPKGNFNFKLGPLNEIDGN